MHSTGSSHWDGVTRPDQFPRLAPLGPPISSCRVPMAHAVGLTAPGLPQEHGWDGDPTAWISGSTTGRHRGSRRGRLQESVTARLCACDSTAGIRGAAAGGAVMSARGVGGRSPGDAPVPGPGGEGRCHVILSGRATAAAPPLGGARAPLGLPHPSSTLSVFARSGLGPSRHCSGLSCGAQLFLSSLVPFRGLSALSVHSRISPAALGALRLSSVQSLQYSGLSVNFRYSSETLGPLRRRSASSVLLRPGFGGAHLPRRSAQRAGAGGPGGPCCGPAAPARPARHGGLWRPQLRAPPAQAPAPRPA